MTCKDIGFSKNKFTSYRSIEKELSPLNGDSLSMVFCHFAKSVYNDSVGLAKPVNKRCGIFYYHCEFSNIDGKLFIDKNGSIFFSGGYPTNQHIYFQSREARLPRKVYRMFGY
jgi:hypothetical protein